MLLHLLIAEPSPDVYLPLLELPREWHTCQPTTSSSSTHQSPCNDLLLLLQVVPCSKRYVHDWTECPFAHPQEKARRRDSELFSYTGIACPSMKKVSPTCAFVPAPEYCCLAIVSLPEQPPRTTNTHHR